MDKIQERGEKNNVHFLEFMHLVYSILQNILIDSNTAYDTTRVIVQNKLSNTAPYAEIIEHHPQYGELKVYKSIIILNKGIIIDLSPFYKIRISQNNYGQYDLILMDTENKFIDFVIGGYSKSNPKTVNSSDLEQELSCLLLILPNSTF
jgi:hypothetical protein